MRPKKKLTTQHLALYERAVRNTISRRLRDKAEPDMPEAIDILSTV